MQRYMPYLAVAIFGSALALVVSALAAYRLSRAEGVIPVSTVGDAVAGVVSSVALTGEDLFGADLEEMAAPAPAATVSEPVEPGRKLLLLGVISGGRPAAILKDMGNDSVAVVPVGGRVFDSNERLLRVTFDEAVVGSRRRSRMLAIGIPSEDLPPPPPPEPAVSRSGEGTRREVSRSELRGSVRSADELIGASKILPAFRQNKIVGFTVNEAVPGTIIHDMGIKSGDIIRSVNGNALDSLERATEIWGKMKGASEVNMVIEREGQETTYSYSLRP